MEYQHLKHTLDIFIDEESKVLILGSFPSVKSREQKFYYYHPQNRFYKVLFSIFDEPLSTTLEERKMFLKRHYIALYDVIEECDIKGSADSSISNVTPFDIASTLKKYPNIKTIGVTGKKAQKLFDKYLLDKAGQVQVIYLPSTSPANARMSLEDLVGQYRKLFEN